MILQFDRTADCTLTAPGPINRQEALALINNAIEANELNGTYEGDYFVNVKNIIPIPATLAFQCIGGPFSLDRNSIEVENGYCGDTARVSFRAKQKCLYFADDIENEDLAITMASVAASSNDVQQSITVNKDPLQERWVISAPKGVPFSALLNCVKDSCPIYARQDSYVANRSETSVS